MTVYYGVLLNGVCAILNMGLDCMKVHKVPYLYLDVTYSHVHFTVPEGIQALLWQGLPDSLPLSKALYSLREFPRQPGVPVAARAPLQACILPST